MFKYIGFSPFSPFDDWIDCDILKMPSFVNEYIRIWKLAGSPPPLPEIVDTSFLSSILGVINVTGVLEVEPLLSNE